MHYVEYSGSHGYEYENICYLLPRRVNLPTMITLIIEAASTSLSNFIIEH